MRNKEEWIYPSVYRLPIPRIQDVIDSLGGNSWFSTLDQGKAYHQGLMAEESRASHVSSPLGAYTNGSAFHLALIQMPPPYSRDVWSLVYKGWLVKLMLFI